MEVNGGIFSKVIYIFANKESFYWELVKLIFENGSLFGTFLMCIGNLHTKNNFN